jgi:serine/threonine-protein kinase RsbT
MNPEALLEPEALAIAAGEDVVRVRQACRSLAADAGLALVDQTKLVTAASELARNALIHAGGGSCRIGAVARGGRTGVRVEVSDDGPGIADLDSALAERHLTVEVGLGLAGARRLVDHFDLETGPARGTRVVVEKWTR